MKHIELFENYKKDEIVLIIDDEVWSLDKFLVDEYYKPCFDEKDYKKVKDMALESKLTLGCNANNTIFIFYKTTRNEYNRRNTKNVFNI